MLLIRVMYIRVIYCVIKIVFINKRSQQRNRIVQTDPFLLSVQTGKKIACVNMHTYFLYNTIAANV